MYISINDKSLTVVTKSVICRELTSSMSNIQEKNANLLHLSTIAWC